ncbi:MAG: hypothetical protein UU24_C0021G0006 [Candidatus Nomurabacteria bacterium GW2011_GWA2_40_9]|uniref:Transposase IS200-like domain-containing protein n=1 Tax=Candidatus Nomurabacteria bacterium GW2011_GWA2_40_9 TaxID=1618734 RepID=A0A0G0WU54_9BACT|nr:MAG: hypothetical protein UU24_C0021G0006 [Candidatus Nomurabacteria bacterium GW2011_GWA2_40_9]
MSIRKTEFVLGEYYHIYNRGNSKQKIFLDDQDRERFLKLLYLYNSKISIDFREDIVKKKINAWDFEKGDSIVNIGAWVLMPNHFHIYLSPKQMPKALPLAAMDDKNAVTNFMHRVSTSFAGYFNAKHKRTGSLFEGKFKSVHIENDVQAKYLFSYIHLNPIKLIDSKWKEEGIKDKKKAIEFLNSYKWSSYLDYMENLRSENKIINRIDFLDYFDTPKDFQKEIFDWIKFDQE